DQISKKVKDIVIIRGNHDSNLETLLPKDSILQPANGVSIGGLGLFHGHKWPSPELLSCKTWIMGHLHPVVTLTDPAGFKITRQVWLKVNINTNKIVKFVLQKNKIKIENSAQHTFKNKYNIGRAKTSQLFIMPSFNESLGGRAINQKQSEEEIYKEELIGPILRTDAVDLGNAEIYLTDGNYLGTINQLKNIK
ncbi:MAG: hypothetical protein GX638_01435, partial [Crenarchaeota archaeon]|nr:hypothetical protein [Thermoproteota archaeon]